MMIMLFSQKNFNLGLYPQKGTLFSQTKKLNVSFDIFINKV